MNKLNFNMMQKVSKIQETKMPVYIQLNNADEVLYRDLDHVITRSDIMLDKLFCKYIYFNINKLITNSSNTFVQVFHNENNNTCSVKFSLNKFKNVSVTTV
jgi:glutathione peroxidase-family protein